MLSQACHPLFHSLSHSAAATVTKNRDMVIHTETVLQTHCAVPTARPVDEARGLLTTRTEVQGFYPKSRMSPHQPWLPSARGVGGGHSTAARTGARSPHSREHRARGSCHALVGRPPPVLSSHPGWTQFWHSSPEPKSPPGIPLPTSRLTKRGPASSTQDQTLASVSSNTGPEFRAPGPLPVVWGLLPRPPQFKPSSCGT